VAIAGLIWFMVVIHFNGKTLRFLRFDEEFLWFTCSRAWVTIWKNTKNYWKGKTKGDWLKFRFVSDSQDCFALGFIFR
jgi:hypothetical protein